MPSVCKSHLRQWDYGAGSLFQAPPSPHFSFRKGQLVPETVADTAEL